MSKSKKKSEPLGALPMADLPVQPSKKIVVRYLPEAPEGQEEKAIHPRRSIPTLPRGANTPDRTTV